MKKTILIIEDEQRLSDSICKYLSAEGFLFLQAGRAEEGLKLFKDHSPDLILLDIMLPDNNGLKVCEAIRTKSEIPIIFLTARIDDNDRLEGFAKGGDDYVCKPFNPPELISRIKAVLRRSSPRVKTEVLTIGTITLSINDRQVSNNGNEITLTQQEFCFLKTMMEQPTKIFSRKELLIIAHGKYSAHYERTIDTHIKNLRKKINCEDSSDNEGGFIKTIYGAGYKFN